MRAAGDGMRQGFRCNEEASRGYDMDTPLSQNDPNVRSRNRRAAEGDTERRGAGRLRMEHWRGGEERDEDYSDRRNSDHVLVSATQSVGEKLASGSEFAEKIDNRSGNVARPGRTGLRLRRSVIGKQLGVEHRHRDAIHPFIDAIQPCSSGMRVE